MLTYVWNSQDFQSHRLTDGVHTLHNLHYPAFREARLTGALLSLICYASNSENPDSFLDLCLKNKDILRKTLDSLGQLQGINHVSNYLVSFYSTRRNFTKNFKATVQDAFHEFRWLGEAFKAGFELREEK